jgi:glycine/D-amino acid oxidase-like deaminating enzyme
MRPNFRHSTGSRPQRKRMASTISIDLDAAAAQRLESQLHCIAALLSPSTGIVDNHALMLAHQGEAEAAGAVIVLRTPVRCGQVRTDGFELTTGGDEPGTIRYRYRSMPRGSMPRPWPAPSRASREIRSRPPISAAASISA